MELLSRYTLCEVDSFTVTYQQTRNQFPLRLTDIFIALLENLKQSKKLTCAILQFFAILWRVDVLHWSTSKI